MKTNEDECHLIVSTNELTEIQIGDFSIKNSGSEKFIVVSTDSKLNFDCHVNHLCNKANKKLRTLARVTPCVTLGKKNIVMNPFFNAQLNYCPLIWMLHSRKNNNKTKLLHGLCLQIIYSDKKSSYGNLSEKDNSVSIHYKKIQALAIEIFKVKHKLCSKITSDIFMERKKVSTPQINSVFHGT